MNDRAALLAFCATLAAAAPAPAQDRPKAPGPTLAPPPAAPAASAAPAAPAAAAPTAEPATTAPAAPAAAAKPSDDDDASDSDESPAAPPADPLRGLLSLRRPHAPPPRPQVPSQAPDSPEPDDGRMGTHQDHWLLTLGLRTSFIASDGFDIFSKDNALPQVSFAAGRTIFSSGPLSFAAVLGWDWGAREADLRGADTSLFVNRVTLGAEARYHLLRRIYAFGRIAPGALNAWTTIADRVVGRDRESNTWAFATDLSAGAAFELAGDKSGTSKHPRLWAGAEGGYGWAQATKLKYDAESDDITSPVRLQPLSLGELAVRGPFFRLVGTLTY
jgi:hypothetical protein